MRPCARRPCDPESTDLTCSGDPVAINDRVLVPHTYAEAGTYQVTVTIESCGVLHTETLTVTVVAP